jgi:hypothetical protein
VSVAWLNDDWLDWTGRRGLLWLEQARAAFACCRYCVLWGMKWGLLNVGVQHTIDEVSE